MLRRMVSAGGFLAGGVALLLSALPARAQDAGFAFYRRDPAEAGTRPAACSCIPRFCRPPRCPPYCDPSFGYYPTVWRAWPSLFVGEEADVATTAPMPKTAPGAPAGGENPKVMPPASDEARRRSTVPGAVPAVTANVR